MEIINWKCKNEENEIVSTLHIYKESFKGTINEQNNSILEIKNFFGINNDNIKIHELKNEGEIKICS